MLKSSDSPSLLRRKALSRIYSKSNRERNRESIARKKAEYFQRITDHQKEKRRCSYRKWKARKYKEDWSFRAMCAIRSGFGVRLRSAGTNKRCKTSILLGCDNSNLRKWIESKFKPGMTFENYADVWEIDHIIPATAFDLKTEDGQRSYCHFTNLQPLTVHENRVKSDNVN
jgi:hypothetical protein